MLVSDHQKGFGWLSDKAVSRERVKGELIAEEGKH